MIVLLTEEPSMGECLELIIPALWPNSTRGVHWMILSFSGKTDLEQSNNRSALCGKMQGWTYGNPHFIRYSERQRRRRLHSH